MFVETVIIGGGFAGINLACMLQQQEDQQDYLLLEQETLLDVWKNSRWDAFQLNTPHGCNRLYGQTYEDDGIDEDSVGRDFPQELAAWEQYVADQKLRYKEHHRVLSVRPRSHNKNNIGDSRARFSLVVEELKHHENYQGVVGHLVFTCRNVVCCTGENAVPILPAVAAEWPKELLHMHSKDFKSPDQFADDKKAVLVVGSGQSGCQIASLLREAGKTVWLCTGSSNGIFASYRQDSIFTWMKRLGFDKLTNEMRQQMPHGEEMRYAKSPIVGAGKALSYFSLARQGVTILGSLEKIQDGAHLVLKPNRVAHVQQSVASYNKHCASVKTWLANQPESSEIHATLAPETRTTGFPEPEWEPVPELETEEGPLRLPLANCQGVIWCTGYRSSVASYLSKYCQDVMASDLDVRTNSPHTLFSQAVPGLYYAGFPWARTAVSALLMGTQVDQQLIIDKIINDATDSRVDAENKPSVKAMS
jgi:putative flavoprotein involved in K+ transport